MDQKTNSSQELSQALMATIRAYTNDMSVTLTALTITSAEVVYASSPKLVDKSLDLFIRQMRKVVDILKVVEEERGEARPS